MGDMYGASGNISGAGAVVGGVREEMRKKAGITGTNPFARKPDLTGDTIQYGLKAFGVNVLRKQGKDLDEVISQVDKDLQELKSTAMQQRRNQQLKEYQHTTQMIAARAEQKMKLKAMQTQRIGEVITGVGAAIALVGGNLLGYTRKLKSALEFEPGNLPKPEGFLQRRAYRKWQPTVNRPPVA